MSHPSARPARPVALNLRTYKAAVYDSLVRMIGELELPPGVRLVEEELANRFHVSKTPVREALLLLESDGVVKLEPYHGATVTWLSLDEYQELLFMQDALEQAALPLVVERHHASATSRSSATSWSGVKRKRQDHDSHGLQRRRRAGPRAAVHHRRTRPRLIRAVMSLITGPTRRYEKVFMHQFDDTWDIELDILAGRFERVRAGDAEAAADHVREGRRRCSLSSASVSTTRPSPRTWRPAEPPSGHGAPAGGPASGRDRRRVPAATGGRSASGQPASGSGRGGDPDVTSSQPTHLSSERRSVTRPVRRVSRPASKAGRPVDHLVVPAEVVGAHHLLDQRVLGVEAEVDADREGHRSAAVVRRERSQVERREVRDLRRATVTPPSQEGSVMMIPTPARSSRSRYGKGLPRFSLATVGMRRRAHELARARRCCPSRIGSSIHIG